MLAAVTVVNSLTLMHYQRTDLRYSSIADFCYQLIYECGNGSWHIRGMAYTRVYTVLTVTRMVPVAAEMARNAVPDDLHCTLYSGDK